ncbi:MAG: bile acid:sodium symporter family protein [Nitrospinaceae bacterium]
MDVDPEDGSGMSRPSAAPGERLFSALAHAFPLWVVLGAALALAEPATATWFQPTWIPLFLGIIMLSMGLTLTYRDFIRVLELPRPVLLGVGLQFGVMPTLGFVLALAFHLPPDFMIGLILTACCPGGTASNVVCFIARLDVALSVTLTTCSTLLAVIMTPFLTAWLVPALSADMPGGPIAVDTWGLLVKTFQVVILPVTAGCLLNHFFHEGVRKVTPYTPFLAVLAIVFIVDYILAVKKQAILDSGGSLVAAVILLHLFGFILGYLLGRADGVNDGRARTLSVEVGMQNSGLATELARSNFPQFALATVPGAISALTHCILGSLLAGLCRILPVGNRMLPWRDQSDRNR